MHTIFIKTAPIACRASMCGLIILVFLSPRSTADAAKETETDSHGDGIEFFERRIRPVLVEHCYECHSADADEIQGGLTLDSRESIRAGGDTAHAVVPGDVDASYLVAALRYEALEMPPDGKLSAEIIADFERWIQMGAPDPRDNPVATKASTSIDWDAAGEFWSFRKPRRQAKPQISRPDWPRSEIDWFAMAKMDEQGLTPNPPADKRTFARRLFFDLIGLPPTPEEMAEFLRDRGPHADERLVNRLLGSPHYGERWARFWLDIARYAEDQAHIVGDNSALFYPNAYLYRDWVIDALNKDMPYDEFIRLQLAADFLEPDDAANRVALGFIGLGPKYYNRSDPQVQADEWEDRVDTVCRGLLGLTTACARCHDHKFDPISTQDYYALAGVFANTEMYNRPLDKDKPLGKDGHAKLPADAMHIVRDGGTTRDIHVAIRGDMEKPGPLVARGFLQILSPQARLRFVEGSGRRELADAIVSTANPLTARVLVNRVWHQHFGRPLVATPSNFGNLGARPTHPRLLDDLAVRFIESGWSWKWLHRQIVLSATYRQSVAASAQKLAADPENRWLARMQPRRLDVEAWRNALLTAAGKLDCIVGGRSADPADPDSRRRTVYSHVSRLQLSQLLALFDFPDPNVHAAQRVATTTPIQKLFVMNSPFVVAQAEALSERVSRVGDSPADRIRFLYEVLFSRKPSDNELDLGMEYLQQASPDEIVWRDYAQALLAVNEMLFVD